MLAQSAAARKSPFPAPCERSLDFVIDGMIKKLITAWADSNPKNGRRKWGQTPVPRARAAGLG
jgi:hypothetical protein